MSGRCGTHCRVTHALDSDIPSDSHGHLLRCGGREIEFSGVSVSAPSPAQPTHPTPTKQPTHVRPPTNPRTHPPHTHPHNTLQTQSMHELVRTVSHNTGWCFWQQALSLVQLRPTKCGGIAQMRGAWGIMSVGVSHSSCICDGSRQHTWVDEREPATWRRYLFIAMPRAVAKTPAVEGGGDGRGGLLGRAPRQGLAHGGRGGALGLPLAAHDAGRLHPRSVHGRGQVAPRHFLSRGGMAQPVLFRTHPSPRLCLCIARVAAAGSRLREVAATADSTSSWGRGIGDESAAQDGTASVGRCRICMVMSLGAPALRRSSPWIGRALAAPETRHRLTRGRASARTLSSCEFGKSSSAVARAGRCTRSCMLVGVGAA